MTDTPSGWYVENNLLNHNVEHVDGATGQVLTYHPTEPDIALIQWDDDNSVQWIGADVIKKH